MSANEELVLLTRPREDGRLELCAPAVGWWIDPPRRGALLGSGEPAGALQVLGRTLVLRVPEGAGGAIVSDAPAARRTPVGYGERLLLLDAESATTARSATHDHAPVAAGAPMLRAPQSGRFWFRPEPGAPAFLDQGAELEDGRTFGLLEVMKTFQPLKYRAAPGQPTRTRLRRWLTEDGAEVEEGQALAEIGD